MEKIIFTMGTSNRTFKEFVEILRVYKIEMVIDVRTLPTSKFPHFQKDNFSQSLAEENFGYFYLGKELGGFRPEGYEAYTQTGAYLGGIELLERMAARCRAVIICAERLPWRCHRRFIGRSLMERGWDVKHIIDQERIWKDKIFKGE